VPAVARVRSEVVVALLQVCFDCGGGANGGTEDLDTLVVGADVGDWDVVVDYLRQLLGLEACLFGRDCHAALAVDDLQPDVCRLGDQQLPKALAFLERAQPVYVVVVGKQCGSVHGLRVDLEQQWLQRCAEPETGQRVALYCALGHVEHSGVAVCEVDADAVVLAVDLLVEREEAVKAGLLQPCSDCVASDAAEGVFLSPGRQGRCSCQRPCGL